MKKKKGSTTDAVEILRRRYGNSLWKRWMRWKIRRQIKKDKVEYAAGFRDGYEVGQKSKEKYPFLKRPRCLTSIELQE